MPTRPSVSRRADPTAATAPSGSAASKAAASKDAASKGSAATSRGALAALLTGAALSLIAGVAVVIDQAGGDSILRHLTETYGAGYDARQLADDKGSLLTMLYSIAGVGLLCWLATLVLARRGSRWVRPVAVGLFVIGGTTTTAGLWVKDEGYGSALPTWLALLFAAAVVPGLVATVALCRRPRAAA